jgi:tRNA pseudouridine13 synthase
MIRVHAKLKHSSEDFIVEEIGADWECKVSEKNMFNHPPDILKIGQPPKDFLWFELEKKDIDHFTAMKDLAFILNKSIGDIGYAGSKDKKAWTSQRVSVFKPDLKKIEKFRHSNIVLKNFKWEKRKIKLGYLEGNRFTIIMRDIDKKDCIKVASTISKSSHFPNFFGEQRFGSVRKNNFEIGKAILKKDFEKAFMSILTDLSENEKEEVTEARKRFSQDKKIEEAFFYFPFYLKTERRLIDHLYKYPKSYLGAIKQIDRKNLLMFVHSVQSKIFNEILERAIDEGIDFTKEGQKNCLLVGYKSRFSSGRLGEIEREVLEKNGLALEDFDLKEIPFLRIKGAYRKALTEVKDLEVQTDEDEIFNNAKKIILKFTLPSGVYATTFLESFFEWEK